MFASPRNSGFTGQRRPEQRASGSVSRRRATSRSEEASPAKTGVAARIRGDKGSRPVSMKRLLGGVLVNDSITVNAEKMPRWENEKGRQKPAFSSGFRAYFIRSGTGIGSLIVHSSTTAGLPFFVSTIR